MEFLKKFLVCSLIISFVSINTKRTYYASENSDFELSSKSAIVMDIDTGEVIYELESNERRQMASTTKLMTALLLSENKDENSVLKFTKGAMAQPSSSIYKNVMPYLVEGEKFYAEDVMNGLLLNSGNDMAVMIADNISGSELEFSNLMDNKAREIGMNNTDFFTASGLDAVSVIGDENHYSTAYDMAILGIESFKNDWIRETMSLEAGNISPIGGLDMKLENTNRNLGLMGCIGGKTGYTTRAGKCLVAFYEREGRTLVGVVLGGSSEGYFDDMNKIMDFSFEEDKSTFLGSDKPVEIRTESVRPLYFIGKKVSHSVPMYIKEDILIYDNKFNKENIKVEVDKYDISLWNISKGDVIGKVRIIQKNNAREYDLYSDTTTKAIVQENTIIYVFYAFILLSAIFVWLFIFKVLFKPKRNLS